MGRRRRLYDQIGESRMWVPARLARLRQGCRRIRLLVICAIIRNVIDLIALQSVDYVGGLIAKV